MIRLFSADDVESRGAKPHRYEPQPDAPHGDDYWQIVCVTGFVIVSAIGINLLAAYGLYRMVFG